MATASPVVSPACSAASSVVSSSLHQQQASAAAAGHLLRGSGSSFHRSTAVDMEQQQQQQSLRQQQQPAGSSAAVSACGRGGNSLPPRAASNSPPSGTTNNMMNIMLPNNNGTNASSNNNRLASAEQVSAILNNNSGAAAVNSLASTMNHSCGMSAAAQTAAASNNPAVMCSATTPLQAAQQPSHIYPMSTATHAAATMQQPSLSGAASTLLPSPLATTTSQTAALAAAANFVSPSLYVGDLHPEVSEAMLFEVFNAVGPVTSIRVCRDTVTRRSLGYAYVNYQNLADAERALDACNYTVIRGRPCRLMWCHRDPALRKSGSGNVFVKNLDRQVDNKALYDTFSLFGNILSCKVALDAATGNSKGYGFVHYESEQSARAAIEKVNGMLLGGKTVFVGPFVRRSEREGVVRQHQLQQQQQQQEKSAASAAPGGSRFTNLYIKNLPAAWNSEKVLRGVFEQFGTITSILLRKDSRGRPFAFCNFAAHAAAKAATEALNGKRFSEAGVEVSTEEESDSVASGDKDKKQQSTSDSEGEDAEDSTEEGGNEVQRAEKQTRKKAEKGGSGDATEEGEDDEEEGGEGESDAVSGEKAKKGKKVKDAKKREDAKDEEGGREGETLPKNKRRGNKEKKVETHVLFVGPHQSKAHRSAMLRAKFEQLSQDRTDRFQGVNLYIKNMEESIDDTQLQQLFEPFGTITSAKVMRDERGVSRGFGFVCFLNAVEATKAVTEMHLKKVKGKPLYVGLAERREQRQMRLQQRRGMISPAMGAPAAAAMPPTVAAAAQQLQFSAAGGPVGGPQMQGTYGPAGGPGVATAPPAMYAPPRPLMGFSPHPHPMNAAMLPWRQQQSAAAAGAAQFAAAVAAGMHAAAAGGPPMHILQQQRMASGGGVGHHRNAIRGSGQNVAVGPPFVGGPVTTNDGKAHHMMGVGMKPPQAGAAAIAQQQQHAALQMQQQGAPSSFKFTPQVRNQRLDQQLQQHLQQHPPPGAGTPMTVVHHNPQQRHPHAVAAAAAALEQTQHLLLNPDAPLTAAALAAAQPSMQKQMLGEKLFPLIARYQPELAGKITGMMLEMDNAELLILLESEPQLKAKVDEALRVLQQAG